MAVGGFFFKFERVSRPSRFRAGAGHGARLRGRQEARADSAHPRNGEHAVSRREYQLRRRHAAVVRGAKSETVFRRGEERRRGRSQSCGTSTLRAHLQALHEEAVGQVPGGARRVRAHAPALPHVDGRPLLRGRLAGAARAGLHAHLREHAAPGPARDREAQRRLLRRAGRRAMLHHIRG